MKVILTEKPSVARDIAATLGIRSRQDGYYEGREYQVTWAFGHLVTLKEPEDYDPALKRWSLDALPFVPDRFELKLIDDKRARQQFAIIRRLFRTAAELICATDAGREGELIFRYIAEMTGCQGKPTGRLWLSSLTQQAIRDAFRNLRPASHYDNLYAAAKCRNEADWIVGLNATRNYTVRFGAPGLLWSAGRVQTPVLAMIARRDDEIRTFEPQAFWELITDYRNTTFRFAGDRFFREEEAQQLLMRVQGHVFTIQKVDARQETSRPPQLYDLTELQRDMNRRYGMSAADVLQIAQALYEHQRITYPRTDSRYLSTDVKNEIPGILRSLQSIKPDEVARLDLNSLPFTPRIVDNKKVGDHHAIIPTTNVPRQLSPRDQKVYDAVVTRLIAALYPSCLKEVTTVHGVSNAVAFRARGIRVTSPGWTELYPRKEDDQKQDAQQLPAFETGESGPHEPSLKKGETTAPKHFTENTLLGAMETAGKLVDDDELKEALKQRGLGTPATRAAIIETLLKRKYIHRTKKSLTATDLGRYLVALIQDHHLKSPELTGEWEARLREIEAGRADPLQFSAEISKYAEDLIRDSDITNVDESTFGQCPRCGSPIIEGRRGFGCGAWRSGCEFVLWKTYKNSEFGPPQIRQLLQRHILARPLNIAEVGEVILTMTDSGALMELPVPSRQPQKPRRKTATQASRRRRDGDPARRRSSTERGGGAAAPLGACPLCGGEVLEQKKSFSCNAWKQGCKFVIWKTIASKRIGRRTARALLRDGESPVLKGFKSKAGKPFDARLKLDEGNVRFEFPA